MAGFSSKEFITEEEERYLLTIVYRSANHMNETAGSVWPKRRIIKLELSNLGTYALSQAQITDFALSLPSLQCELRTDEHFDQTWCKERLNVCEFRKTSIIPLSAAQAEEERRRRTVLVTQYHPEQIDIPALANTQNNFNMVHFGGETFVRVTCSVHAPDGGQSPSKWRVSHYSLEGQMILSVICTMNMDLEISSSEESRTTA